MEELEENGWSVTVVQQENEHDDQVVRPAMYGADIWALKKHRKIDWRSQK